LRLRVGRGDALIGQLAVGHARRHGLSDGEPAGICTGMARSAEAGGGRYEEA
jgi:hypothetical protein